MAPGQILPPVLIESDVSVKTTPIYSVHCDRSQTLRHRQNDVSI